MGLLRLIRHLVHPRRWRDDRVSEALLKHLEPGEVLILPPLSSRARSFVASHWVVYVPKVLEGLLGLLLAGTILARPDGTAKMLILPALLVFHAAYTSYRDYLDVMVITNIRVFRITGLPVSKRASMPLSRILDVTVRRPLLGAILDYGHFTFESAAQTQGMKDVRFVPHPFDYEKMILQYVHTSSGRR